MYPSVLLAAKALGYANESDVADISSEDKIKFNNRMDSFPEHLRPTILQMYAYPFVNRNRALKGELDEAIAAESKAS